MRINTNIASLNAQTNAANTNKALSSSLEKLSSGLAINKAADDASGMAIADKLRTQASSLGQGISNANSGSALIQIADKALGEQSNILDTVKTKLIQASTSTTSAEGREAVRKDISKLLEQFDAISEQTNYNGINLLNNKGDEFSFQTGEYAESNISMELSRAVNTESLGALGEKVSKAEGTMEFSADITLLADVDGGKVTVVNTKDDGVVIATTGVGMTVAVSGENVEKITSGTGDITLKTSDAALIAKLDAIAATDTGSNFTRNGEGNYTVEDGKILDFGSEGVDLNKVELSVAAASDTFTIDTDGESGLTIEKKSAAAAANITISNTADDMTGTIDDTSKVGYTDGVDIKSGSISVQYGSTNATAATAASNNQAIGINTVVSTAITDQTFTVDAEQVSSITVTQQSAIASVNLTTSNSELMDKLEEAAGVNKYLTNNGDGSFTLKATAADKDASLDFGDDKFDLADLEISGVQGSSVANDVEKVFITTQEAVTVTNESSDGLSVNAVDMLTKANDTGLRGADMSKTVVGETLDNLKDLDVDGLTAEIAMSFMASVDDALTQLNDVRADFGSTQSQVETAIRSMMVTKVNIQAAESVIRDTDYAAESASFNKQNIIAQAGTYAMSQANSMAQNVQKLLQ